VVRESQPTPADARRTSGLIDRKQHELPLAALKKVDRLRHAACYRTTTSARSQARLASC
jgi:hypothetical protein